MSARRETCFSLPCEQLDAIVIERLWLRRGGTNGRHGSDLQISHPRLFF
jgi:hypothetical protein